MRVHMMRIDIITEPSKYDTRRELRDKYENKKRKQSNNDECMLFPEVIKRVQQDNYFK
jgi:hypothetical protein